MGDGTPHGETLGRTRPVFVALAWAVGPHDGLTEVLVDATVAEVEAMVAVLGPMARQGLLAAATALEHGTRAKGGRPFSALDRDEAIAVLARWRRTPLGMVVGLLRDLIVIAHYEQPEVRASVGYLPDPLIEQRKAERLARWGEDIEAHQRLLVTAAPLRPGATPAAAPAPSSGSAVTPAGIRAGDEIAGTTIDCDVVIIGSGAGGGVMAAELAEAGLSVVVLEEGGHHPTSSFTTSTTGALRSLYREGGATSTIGRAPIGYAEGRGVGGGTVVNGGMSFRAPERILAGWAARSGDRGLSGGRLDDSYARVERFLSVGPPDPGSVGRDQTLMRRGAELLGWQVIEDQRNHVHCGGCNVCTWGCPTGAKQSTLVSYLPRAVAFGATVFSGCRVDHLVMEGKRAAGVSGRFVGDAEDGRNEVPANRTHSTSTFLVRARHVVLCAGAIQTPALLQRSGVRSPSGQIGRNLTVHPGTSVVAVFDEEVRGWDGAHQSLQVREFEAEGAVLAAVNLPPSLVARGLRFDGDELAATMAQYNHMVTAGVLIEDTGSGRVRAMGAEGVLPTYNVNDFDAARVARSIVLLSEALLTAGAHTVHLPFAGRDPVHSVDELHRAGAVPVAAKDMQLSTVHLMGTARIGVDPLWAVCDPFGSVHDTVGLSIADASLFPAPVGVNPMLTIMALATRVAGRVIDQW
jgi:choline dehydrogenase-like flavoprotein